jgi:saccharopine dehydrogenase-like NADP-dependent oxidoreductase
MLAEGKIRQKGVLPPECLDPLPILRELGINGVDTYVHREETTKIQSAE